MKSDYHKELRSLAEQQRHAPFANDVIRLLDALEAKIHIVFDGPPGPEAGRFVEVEDSDGRSICYGDWVQRGDYWHLVLPDAEKLDEPDEMEATRMVDVDENGET